MEIPNTRASAFQRRNRSTHCWYDGDMFSGDALSRSCPSPRTLDEHMRHARAARTSATSACSWNQGWRASDSSSSSSSVIVKAKGHPDRGYAPSSSVSSPGPSTSSQTSRGFHRGSGASLLSDKPSAAYSYDGGFFVTANTPNKDFFVIHPEWVSEARTFSSRWPRTRDEHVTQRQASPSVITWASYKRSKSAPPAKFRNPITWED